MIGRRLKSMPDGQVEDDVEYGDEKDCTRRFRYLSKKKQHFWNRWRREYLADLREFHRGKRDEKKRVVEKGDVVIVYEDNVKRSSWKTAVVEGLITGRDGVVRGARVRLVKNGKIVHLSRPVQKLYPTEVKHDEGKRKDKKIERCETSEGKEKKEESQKREVRPRRAAALDSVWKTRSMID